MIAGFLIQGCSPGKTYDRMLKRELASGVRYDSLFMGIYLGMTDKEFYTHCWDLNRDGLVKQGTKNTTVEYGMKEELRHPATMDFYPEFAQGKIIEMPVRFIYNGWSPWNKNLSSDSLQIDVLHWYEEVYGAGFMAVQHPERGTAFVKVNGNRRITIFKQDEMHVWAVFTDMLAIQELKDSTSTSESISDEIIQGFEE